MHGNTLLLLFLQVCVILAASRLAGVLFRYLGQPHVIGEMVAGILLGPSLLGWVAPDAYAWLFPAGSVRYLSILSQLGVVFFLFLIGLELDPALLRNRGHTAVVVSHISIIAPFLLGAVLALFLYPRVFNDTPTMSFRAVALFMGAAMSITAFPVLARILTERNLHKTKVGAVAITCAAVDDVTAWCMLAFVVAVAQFQGVQSALVTAGLSALYVAAMFLIVRPFLRKLEAVYEHQGRLSQNVVAIILGLVLLSASATEAIGIHALFGAFLLGCIMPKGTAFVRHVSEKIEDFTVVLLLPIFFAYSGLRTRIGLLDTPELWVLTGLVIAVACAGKFGGSTLAARACGLAWRESAAIGILMNTRGLMELVILNIGRELGVITDAVFAMMVLMAIVTTAMTSPVLRWVYPQRLMAEEDLPQRARREQGFSVLVPVSLPRSGGPLVQIADALMGREAPVGKIYALHLTSPEDPAAHATALGGQGDRAVEQAPQPLAPLLAQAAARSIPVEPIALISGDVAADIAATAEARHVDLVLMGFHKPVFGKALLGGTVHRVMGTCPAHVAVFMDRGFRAARRILVPYLGSAHDQLALELAARMARNTGAHVQVLHVAPPMRVSSDRVADARSAVQRIFGDPSAKGSAAFKVVEDQSPVGVILHQAQQFDLVIIGVAEEWGLESRLFGWRPETIARDCPASLLIVRRFEGSPSVSPDPAPPVEPPIKQTATDCG